MNLDISTEPNYTISIAARFGISVHTLRMYEKERFVIPFKKSSKHRLYSRADIEKIGCNRRGIAFGIKILKSLAEQQQLNNHPLKQIHKAQSN